MRIFKKETFDIAFIDPKKKIGDEGQYVRRKVGANDISALVEEGKAQGFEVRRYVENLTNSDEGIIPLKYVITEVPSGHVQPFHAHSNVDEINLIEDGEVYFVESETIAEDDYESIRKEGILLRSGDVVVSSHEKRHTIANLSGAYSRIIGTISAKSTSSEFKPDWKR